MYDSAPDNPVKLDRPRGFQINDDIIDEAVNAIKIKTSILSASRVLNRTQSILAIVSIAVFASALIFATAPTIAISSSFIAVYFIADIVYRAFLMWAGSSALDPPLKATVADADLPVITILAPLYRDACALNSLSDAIDRLDYPKNKMDVILLLESDDEETIEKAYALSPTVKYRIIIAPDIGPKTKPKACNLGLGVARGEFVVIYDAEDRPEPDQLKKAANAFANADCKVACLQARLNYYNARENWLTRMFTLEYCLWFDWLLPALQKIGAPIPLGGTSNFFRTEVLRNHGGWDPYNVTEDADLGLRLSRLGYRVEMLDSTTYEEANCRLGNWIRQRSRWIKGHLQTWLVHMRAPQGILRTTGVSGLISVQFFLAGNVFSALINPILWLLFIRQLFFPEFAGPSHAMAIVEQVNIFALIVGNTLFISFAVIAPLKRGWKDICVFGVTAPIYWILTSIAAYKAIWQILFKPFYWEKTDHMISRYAQKHREDVTHGQQLPTSLTRV